jgi:hypothetical protein
MARQGMKLVWMDGCMDGKEKGERRKIDGIPGCRFLIFWFFFPIFLVRWLWMDRGEKKVCTVGFCFSEREKSRFGLWRWK